MFQENLEQSVIKYTKGKYLPLILQARHTSATIADMVCETSSLYDTTETGVQVLTLMLELSLPNSHLRPRIFPLSSRWGPPLPHG